MLSALLARAGEFKQFYIENGKTVTNEQAILGAIRGNEVYLCKSVEAKVSKAGTSIAVHSIKKPAKAKL